MKLTKMDLYIFGSFLVCILLMAKCMGRIVE